MPWICGKHGICPDSERECEECEHFSENNEVHWTDDKAILLVVKGLQEEIERLKAKQRPMIAKGINGTFGSGIGYCPSCGNGMHYANYPGQLTQHYCDQCGQAVKWSD